MNKKKILKKVIFGTWPISGDYSKVNNNKSINLLRLAYKSGINEFDTAPNYGYGNSEFLIGKAFEQFKVKPKINTKIGNNHKKIKSFSLSFLKKSFQNSLKILKIKKINILYLHNPLNISNSKEIFKYLAILKKEKKIKDFGLSISKDFKYKEKFINKFKIIQLDHNILYLKNSCNKQFNKKIIHARSPFASGTIFLLNKKKFFSDSDFRLKWLSEERKKIIILQLKHIKKTFNKDVYDLSLNFLFNDKFVNKIIIGVKSIAQLNNFLKKTKVIQKNIINVSLYKKFFFSQNIFKDKGF